MAKPGSGSSKGIKSGKPKTGKSGPFKGKPSSGKPKTNAKPMSVPKEDHHDRARGTVDMGKD